MSASHGSKAVVMALLANMGIAVTKFIAFVISGSAAMLAESVHSVADSGNQALLLLGGRQARRKADQEHPFGYGRERYIYAFIVAIVLFSVGGLFSIYAGIEKLQNPHPLEVVWLPIAVLVIAIILESSALRVAVKESNQVRKPGQSWWSFIRRSKSPELPVILLEDTAALLGLVFALLGVGLTILTGNPVWDAVGTLFIGALLVLVAIILGLETKSLLVGEGANLADDRRIRYAMTAHPEVTELIHMKTLYLGPEELLVAAKLGFAADRSLADISRSTNEIEDAVRAAVPVARVIYIEPDIFRPLDGPAPPTDAIIIKAAD